MKSTSAVREDLFDGQFAREVTQGLKAAQKSIPSTWLYDRRGSELFEEITHLPEYYPTRSELAILRTYLPSFGRGFPKHASVIEIGAGSSRKTRLLLAALREPYAYLPVDISAEFLLEAVGSLQEAFPDVRCTPLVLDFSEPQAMLTVRQRLASQGPVLGFFPGSTIGNFAPEAATQLLSHLGHALGDGATLLIGIDSTCDPSVLVPAYDDKAGVTAQFNLNLLTRINRELGGDFAVERFCHEARFNETESRIEMHLVSRAAQRVAVLGQTYVFQAGESIHTENSYKYTRSRFLELTGRAGFASAEVWTDPNSGFEVHALRRPSITPKQPKKGF